MTQLTTSVNGAPQAANGEVFSNEIHDRVLRQIHPKTIFAATAEPVINVLAVIRELLGWKESTWNIPPHAEKLMQYRWQVFHTIRQDAANDDKQKESKAA
jgi:hypothetical protein